MLKLKGGSDESTNKKLETLAKESVYSELRVNKVRQKLLNLTESFISDLEFGRVLVEFETLMKLDISHPLETYASIQSGSSLSFFAEIFSNTRHLSPIQKRILLKIVQAQNNFLNNTEKLTYLRREQLL